MSRSTEVAPSWFRFRAMGADGVLTEGRELAVSAQVVRSTLAARGLFPIDVRSSGWSLLPTKVPNVRDRALGLRLLATLLESGLTLERSLMVFGTVAPKRWLGRPLETMRAGVQEGRPLGQTMRDAALGMPSHLLGIIDAGESGGRLGASLRDAAAMAEQESEHTAAIQGALAYPAILALAGSCATALLVGIVLPRFAALLADVDQQLPPSAALLLAAGDMASRFGPAALLVLGASVVAVVTRYRADARLRVRLHEALLALPLVGSIRQATATARVAAALSALLEVGVPIAPALARSASAAGDAAVEVRVRDARDRVIRGERLSDALAATLAVRDGVTHLVRVGEATSQLSAMLATASRLEREWSVTRLRVITRLVEPSLILMFGALIAFVAAALLQSVYAMRPIP